MSKERFLVLLDRWRSSGLSIKDFCANEVYTESSFYYWKSKFGFSRSYRTQATDTPIDKFAPVSFKPSPNTNALAESSTCSPNGTPEEICIDLPNGVSIRFKGGVRSGAALSLLTQICSSYVLPK